MKTTYLSKLNALLHNIVVALILVLLTVSLPLIIIFGGVLFGVVYGIIMGTWASIKIWCDTWKWVADPLSWK